MRADDRRVTRAVDHRGTRVAGRKVDRRPVTPAAVLPVDRKAVEGIVLRVPDSKGAGVVIHRAADSRAAAIVPLAAHKALRMAVVAAEAVAVAAGHALPAAATIEALTPPPSGTQ
jgi:hypothetical protein